MVTLNIPDYTVSELLNTSFGVVRTVLIVEDHEIVRDSMRRLVSNVLNGEGGTAEIMEAATLQAARAVVKDLHGGIDLILLDLDLPDATASDSLSCLQSEWAGLPVAVVSATEDWSLVVKLMNIGVLGFLPKKCSVGILTNALRLIFAGGRYFPDEAFRSLESGASYHHPERKSGTVAALSPRQNEVLALMLDGMSNKEIARHLGLSVGTTKNYVAAILHALGISSRAKVMRAVNARTSMADGDDKADEN